MHVEKDTQRDDSPIFGYGIVAVTVSEGGTVLWYSHFSRSERNHLFLTFSHFLIFSREIGIASWRSGLLQQSFYWLCKKLHLKMTPFVPEQPVARYVLRGE